MRPLLETLALPAEEQSEETMKHPRPGARRRKLVDATFRGMSLSDVRLDLGKKSFKKIPVPTRTVLKKRATKKVRQRAKDEIRKELP